MGVMTRTEDSGPGGKLVMTCVAVAAVAIGVVGTMSSAAGELSARAAKSQHFTESAKVKRSGERGTLLIERGNATGTYNALMIAEIVVHARHATANITFFLRGGLIGGYVTANTESVGTRVYLGGSMLLMHCTGKFRSACERNHQKFGFSGMIDRSKDFEGELNMNGELNT
jgi:hypothetical protein